jgi:hypothetical protein
LGQVAAVEAAIKQQVARRFQVVAVVEAEQD